MKVFVIILGLALILMANTGEGKRCGSREERRKMLTLRKKVACMMPTEQLVTLPLPQGFDFLYPKATILKKCSGFVCAEPNHQCVGVKGTNRTFTVTGHTIDSLNSLQRTCVQVTVEEDHECGCQCITKPEHCSQTQVFNEHRCKCMCRTDLRNLCMAKQKREPSTYMWDPENCMCMCDVVQECSSGTHWIPDLCSCRAVRME